MKQSNQIDIIKKRDHHKKRCLFVCYGGGHSKMVLPVHRALKARGWDSIVLALTLAGNEFLSSGEQAVGMSDFSGVCGAKAMEYGIRLSAGMPAGKVRMEETVAYLGACFQELVEDHGYETALNYYQARGRRAFLPRRTMAKVIKAVEPDIVVATSSPRAEKASILAARDLGVKSLCMLDLFGVDSDEDVVEHIKASGYGNKIAVLGDPVKRWLESCGRPSNEIEVTGNPAFDQYAINNIDDLARRYREGNGWTGKKVLLWASHKNPDRPTESRDIDGLLIDAVSKTKDWILVIRPHPGEDFYPEKVPANVRVSIPGEEPLAPLLAACDGVVTKWSTVGIEGLLLKKPLITLDYLLPLGRASYSSLGLSIGVSNSGCIAGAIRELESGNSPRPLLSAPGGATDNVVFLLERMTNSMGG